MSLIIGFGHRAHMGKDLVAAHIIAERSDKLVVKRYAFGDLLKVETFHALVNRADPFWSFMKFFDPKTYYESILVPKPENPFISKPEDKVAWINEKKVLLRHILQVFGSEYRRAQDPFYWVRLLGTEILTDKPQVALITDVRFENEAFFIKANEGFTVKVVREGFDNGVGHHQSEQNLKDYVFDFTISVAEGNLDELRSDALSVFDRIIDDVTPKNLTTDDFTAASFADNNNQEISCPT